MTNLNPYASPEVETVPSSLPGDGEIIFGWERLRLIYNGMLALAIGLPLPLMLGDIPPEFFVSVAIGLVAANFCYCSGPIMEAYACWLRGGKVRWLRSVLFVAGTGISVLITWLSVVGFLLSPF